MGSKHGFEFGLCWREFLTSMQSNSNSHQHALSVQATVCSDLQRQSLANTACKPEHAPKLTRWPKHTLDLSTHITPTDSQLASPAADQPQVLSLWAPTTHINNRATCICTSPQTQPEPQSQPKLLFFIVCAASQCSLNFSTTWNKLSKEFHWQSRWNWMM